MSEEKNIYLIRLTYSNSEVDEIYTKPLTEKEFYEEWEKPMLAREFPFTIECRSKETVNGKPRYDRQWITQAMIDNFVIRIEEGIYHGKDR